MVGANLHRFDGGFHRRERGEEDDEDVLVEFLDLAEDRHAVGIRKLVVEQDEVDALAELLECTGAGAGLEDLVTLALEALGQRPPDQGFIIDDEDSWSGHVPRLCSNGTKAKTLKTLEIHWPGGYKTSGTLRMCADFLPLGLLGRASGATLATGPQITRIKPRDADHTDQNHGTRITRIVTTGRGSRGSPSPAVITATGCRNCQRGDLRIVQLLHYGAAETPFCWDLSNGAPVALSGGMDAKPNLQHHDITDRVINVFFATYNELAGFPEFVLRRAMAIAIRDAGLVGR